MESEERGWMRVMTPEREAEIRDTQRRMEVRAQTMGLHSAGTRLSLPMTQDLIAEIDHLRSEMQRRLADERARGLEDAAYLASSASDAEVFRAQAARLRKMDVESPTRRPLVGAPTPPLGERTNVIARVDDHGHRLVVATYRFHDGTERPYVEVHESHDSAGPARVLPLPEAVHLMQNVSLDELHVIGGREIGVLYDADSTTETLVRGRAVQYPVHGIGAEVP